MITRKNIFKFEGHTIYPITGYLQAYDELCEEFSEELAQSRPNLESKIEEILSENQVREVECELFENYDLLDTLYLILLKNLKEEVDIKDFYKDFVNMVKFEYIGTMSLDEQELYSKNKKLIDRKYLRINGVTILKESEDKLYNCILEAKGVLLKQLLPAYFHEDDTYIKFMNSNVKSSLYD